MEVSGQLHAPGKESENPLDRRLGRPQSRSGRGGEERKSHIQSAHRYFHYGNIESHGGVKDNFKNETHNWLTLCVQAARNNTTQRRIVKVVVNRAGTYTWLGVVNKAGNIHSAWRVFVVSKNILTHTGKEWIFIFQVNCEFAK
jgi:hypothetical protein